ncbi:TPA: nucleotide-binding protein [Enterobacter asburiae]|nr:nucleotide-binding protein [Enterobacter asburiae]
MLYHVVIKEKNKEKRYYGEHKTDLTKEQLIARFIEPYEQGNPITVNGMTILPSEIERIVVRASENTIESYIPAIKMEDQRSSVSVIGGPSYMVRAVSRAKDVTDEFITGPAGHKKQATSSQVLKKVRNHDVTKVFIVHGHDENAKIKAARFIEQLGFKAVILHEQVSSGRTIIEKIEQYSDVGFAVVLYTPDDIGNQKGKSEQLNLRARQNVVFEHGYLIGKLGRPCVTALVDGDVELPNDISGVVYTKMDEAGGWRLALAQELKQAGYDVDMNKLFV